MNVIQLMLDAKSCALIHPVPITVAVTQDIPKSVIDTKVYLIYILAEIIVMGPRPKVTKYSTCR